MTTRKQALDAIRQQGGQVDWDVTNITGTDKYICVDAPEGMMWDASQAESFVVWWYCGPTAEFWDQVIEFANQGVT